VWYASYGSNMCFERFLCYIVGGKVEGMQRTCEGCGNKSHPIKSQRVTIPHPMYFSKESITWGGGGVAFLHPSKIDEEELCTIGRMYLITVDQFQGVVAQENGFRGRTDLIDFQQVKQKKTLKVSDGWYGHVMHIGDHEGYPILTFSNNLKEISLNPPNNTYTKTIVTGLKQMGLEPHTIIEYLNGRMGISGYYQQHELQEVVRSSPLNLEFSPSVPELAALTS